MNFKLVLLGENVSVHVQKWIKGILNHPEVDIHVITFDRGTKFEGVTYHYIKKYTGSKLDYFLNVFKVKNIIRKVNPDIVHAHHSTSYGFLAAFSGFHPLVITGWGSDILDSPKNPFLNVLLKNTFKKADAITVLSYFTQKEMGKLTNKNVDVIPFGVDISKFSPSTNKETGKDASIVKIGTIRTLSEKYGVEYLIRAFALLCQNHQNIQLEIVGDGSLKSQLESLCLELGIEKKVIFHGYVNQNADFEKYISILSNLDIFAILSILDSETFGVAAVEAMACEIPVVATSVGGLPEVVVSDKSGIIVPPKNVEATAQALEKLIVNPELRIQMGKFGRQRAESIYNWPNNVKQMIDLYKKSIVGK